MIKINSKDFHFPIDLSTTVEFSYVFLFTLPGIGVIYLSMRKKYMSTPPFVTTEHDIDDDSGRKLHINVASSVCCSADGQTVYLADSTGLRKSEDGGRKWEVLVSSE